MAIIIIIFSFLVINWNFAAVVIVVVGAMNALTDSLEGLIEASFSFGEQEMDSEMWQRCNMSSSLTCLHSQAHTHSLAFIHCLMQLQLQLRGPIPVPNSS